MFRPFTVWRNCSSDLKIFANSWPLASNFKFFSQSLDHFFLTVGQNNFGNKIPFLLAHAAYDLTHCAVNFVQFRCSALMHFRLPKFRVGGRSENLGRRGSVFWMGFYADISSESRCNSEMKVWAHFYNILLFLWCPCRPHWSEMLDKSKLYFGSTKVH